MPPPPQDRTATQASRAPTLRKLSALCGIGRGGHPQQGAPNGGDGALQLQKDFRQLPRAKAGEYVQSTKGAWFPRTAGDHPRTASLESVNGVTVTLRQCCPRGCCPQGCWRLPACTVSASSPTDTRVDRGAGTSSRAAAALKSCSETGLLQRLTWPVGRASHRASLVGSVLCVLPRRVRHGPRDARSVTAAQVSAYGRPLRQAEAQVAGRHQAQRPEAKPRALPV